MATMVERQSIPMVFPTVGEIGGTTPIVIIGPNGVGKSRLLRSCIGQYRRFVSSQRRTYLEDQIPAWRPEQSVQQFESQLSNALNHPWQPTSEIDAMFARLVQEHYAALYAENENLKAGKAVKGAVVDTALERLESFWEAVFVNRKLSFSDFSPTVQRLYGEVTDRYSAKTMSDGERSCLYMAARVLSADPGLLVIDEPELHLHRKLSIDYWNKLEEMRPDVRFVYITHDLHFALSRRDPTILMVREGQSIERVEIRSIPPSLVEEVLGAATLTTNAQRFIFFEGIDGQGIAYKLFKVWITGPRTAAIGVGGRRAVLDAGRAFREVGIINNAEVISFVDRDHGPEEWLSSLRPPAFAIALHEIESTFALPAVLRAVADYVGYDGVDPWGVFLERARDELERTLARVVTDRVRANIRYLLDTDMFSRDQIKESIEATLAAHMEVVARARWNSELPRMFKEEENFIRELMTREDHSILIVYSGKQALNDAAHVLGMDRERYSEIILVAIKDPNHSLHRPIVAEMANYLPSRE